MPGIEGCAVLFFTSHQGRRRLRGGGVCAGAAQRLLMQISGEPVLIAIGHRLVGHDRSGDLCRVGDYGTDVGQVGTV